MRKKKARAWCLDCRSVLGRFSYMATLAILVNPNSQGLFYASVYLSYLSMAISN